MKLRHLISTLLIVGSVSSPAVACSASAFPNLAAPFQGGVGELCEFEKPRAHVVLSGRPAQNIGDGKVIQLLQLDAGCSSDQFMLVAECTANKAFLMEGTWAKSWIEGYRSTSVTQNIYPQGQMKIFGADSLADIKSKAAEAGMRIQDNTSSVEGFEGRVSFDDHCGCKHFYPDSPGAKL